MDNETFAARITQIDDEVGALNADLSGVKSDVSGIKVNMDNLIAQFSRFTKTFEENIRRSQNESKTNWAVFAAFAGLAVTLSSLIFAANIYIIGKSILPLETDIIHIYRERDMLSEHNKENLNMIRRRLEKLENN